MLELTDNEKIVLRFLIDYIGHWCTHGEGYSMPTIQTVLPQLNKKEQISIMRNLLNKRLITGCDCGCRGDWEISREGLRLMGYMVKNDMYRDEHGLHVLDNINKTHFLFTNPKILDIQSKVSEKISTTTDMDYNIGYDECYTIEWDGEGLQPIDGNFINV